MKQVKTIFQWLNEITLYKSSPEEFSQESWDKWNSWLIHKYVSMNMDYIDIANYVQKINPQNKKQIYSIYREMLPKKKVYLKYVKNENKKNYKELAEYIADYLECGLGEADEYIPILQEHGIRGILWKMGVEEEETEKLIKKAEL